MDNVGLFFKFKVNRPLTEEEQQYQLKQDKRLDVEPLNQLSTIGMNSNYLEMVDKYYGWKGFMTLFSLVIVVIISGFLITLVSISVNRFDSLSADEKLEEIVFSAIFFLLFLPLLLVGVWLFLKEAFAYTHYPIRINRKNGKIYVFRLDGTILSMPWRDVFFTVGKGRPRGSYDDIRGHVLDADGVTIKETFALSHFSGKDDPDLMQFWEYVRRYVEDGPAKLIPKIEHVIEISHKRETFWNGFHRLMAEMAPIPVIAYVTAPFWFVVAIFRYFAMRTSKIPQWPQWVEDECPVDANDPYQRDEQHPHLGAA